MIFWTVANDKLIEVSKPDFAHWPGSTFRSIYAIITHPHAITIHGSEGTRQIDWVRQHWRVPNKASKPKRFWMHCNGCIHPSRTLPYVSHGLYKDLFLVYTIDTKVFCQRSQSRPCKNARCAVHHQVDRSTLPRRLHNVNNKVCKLGQLPNLPLGGTPTGTELLHQACRCLKSVDNIHRIGQNQ